MRILLQDLRFALRQMIKRPGFTAVVILTMALGIGANAAIFSVLDAVLLRPLPYPQPQQLIKIWTRFTGIGQPNDQNWVSAPELRDLQQLNHSFSDLAAISTGSVNLGFKGSPKRVVGASVSPVLFKMLGAQPLLGRVFLPEEAQPGRDGVVILSYGLWKRNFAGNPGVVGSTIDIDGAPMIVVGVMPAGFSYPDQCEIWGPLAFGPNDLAENNRGSHGLEVLGRVKPGISFAQAQSDMDRAAKTIIEQHKSYPYEKYGFGIILHPLLEETVGDVKTSLWVLMAAVGLVLLIACANIANLLLVRSSERQQEMGVRQALGASGSRLVRQLLTESVLLALIGGLAGIALTPWALRGLIAISVAALPRTVGTSINGTALLLMLAISLATGILFGLAPAIQSSAKRNWAALKSAHSTEGSHAKRLRRILVIAETALSVILLAGAGLLMRSFAQILRVDPGFRPENVLTMNVSLDNPQYAKPDQIRGFYNELLGRIRKEPGVLSAGAVSLLPLSGRNSSGTVTIDSQSVPLEDTTPEADGRFITTDYFKAMGISVLRGRSFEDHDTDGAPLVCIVDQTLADIYWPNQDPIGKRIHFGDRSQNPPQWATVVGVVSPVRNRTLEARSRIGVYLPENQMSQPSMTIAVRTAGNPMNLAPTMEREVSTIDPDLPVYRVRTMTQVMGESVQRRRLALILLAVFAGLALALASVGIYGVTSYAVAQRQVEIGLRMALGADRFQVLRMMIGQGMTTIFMGLGIGIISSLALTRLIRGLLFAVRPSDPLALAGAALVLMAAAFLAVYIPSRRATHVEPIVALRYE
ncbi:MAG TPA: ABC transporter permease [Terracidiphilus sp.]|nr:ABC transporter permease [Terracidiphilus sp.]